MIFGFLIKFILSVLAFFFNLLFFPFRSIAPSFIVFDDIVTNISFVMASLFNSTFNFFAYFSHTSAVRLMFFVVIFSMFAFPILYVLTAIFKFIKGFIK